MHRSSLLRLQTIVLVVAVVVLPAKEPHATDVAFIKGHYSLPIVHSPADVHLSEIIPFLHMMRFEIWLFPWANGRTSSSRIFCRTVCMHLHAICRLNELLSTVGRSELSGIELASENLLCP